MEIHLTGTKPIFEEITDAIRTYIVRGIFKDGEKMPSVRDLAISLAINPNTVMGTYQVLTDEGLLISLPKKGIYVSNGNKDDKVHAELTLLLKQIIDEGYSIADIQNTLIKIQGEK